MEYGKDVQHKDMPQQAFAGKMKKGEKYHANGSPHGHQVEAYCDVFFLTTAHKDMLVEAPLSSGAHHKIKPAALLDYKSNLLLPCPS
jgi:hypothetical protein